MCSHESITWEVTDNSVTDRMIENSLIHKFRPSRKLRKRTKVLNAKIKKYGVKNYKHYVELKTNVLRNFTHDTDTDDSSSLTDIDYDIIYSSPSKQAKYVTTNFERYRFSSEEGYEEYKNEGDKNVKCKKKSRSRNTERRIQTRNSPRLNTVLSINTGWQEVIKKNSSVSQLRKQMHTNILDNEGNLEDSDHFKAQSSKQSLSSRFDSQNSISNIMKSGNEYMRKDHKDSNAMDNESSFEDNTVSNKTKPVSERKIQNYKQTNQSVATINESNTEFNSHGSHYQSSLFQLTNLENSNNSDNELNSLVKLEDSNKSAAINENSINMKNYDTYVSHKLELLRNVKRNLISTLEKADSTNNDKDIKTDNSVEDELNYDQLLPDITNLNQHSTPLKKIQTNVSKDLSPDALSQDHQKDSGIDDDSQDRFVKIKRFNKISTSRNVEKNMEKVAHSSPQLKRIDKIVDEKIDETDENCKEIVKDAHLKFNNDIIGEQISKGQNESSGEEKMKNSLQLNQIDVNIETNQEDKEDEHFVKVEDSNDIQNQLSPKQDCMKETHSESCNLIQEEEDNEKIKTPEKEEIFFQLNKINNSEINAEISSINYKGKQDSEEEKESSREEINILQSSQVDNVTEIYSTNHEDQTHFVEAEDSCNIQEQQLLLKIKYTEILNKKYKIIDKNDVKNNIEEINNINNNNINIANEYTVIKKNTLIHSPDQNINNWQKVAINEEEIDVSMALETDNEEDNLNYMSPQTKKRLQQQARLNLIVSSDSNESDDEYVTTLRKHIDSSDTSHCSENDRLKNETNCASKQTKMEISYSEDISHSKEATVPIEVVKLDLMKEEIKKKTESLIRCTYENNHSFQSTTNKNPSKETQDCENVHNDDHDENQDKSFQLKISENSMLCNNEESINHQFRKPSLLDKQNICTKSNEEAISAELGTRHESEQSAQALVNCSNAHLNISRPRNLQQLVEDQELLVETIPASFTFSDLSEDEEAFILNVPNKVVQSNLQGQLLTLKEKSIKFNESKYKIVCKEVGNTSCIFATGKKRKPYKIINIKKISTITIREKLPQDSRKPDILNSYNTVFSMPKPTKIKRQTNERDSKTLKISNHKKRKRRESSDFDTEYLR